VKPVFILASLSALLLACACGSPASGPGEGGTAAADTLRYPEERHLKNIRQLTFGGDNAEAYFSFDDRQLIFQATNPKWSAECDQIFVMPTAGVGREGVPQLVSTGQGRTTCSFFLPGDSLLLYASTHLGGATCPSAPRSINGKYVWALFGDFDIFVSDLKGNIRRQLTKEPGYDAEATVSPDGQKIVFTSTRSGDIELYTMNLDGSDVRQITHELGYDGGAFFSPDGKRLVFRASRPQTPEEVAGYKELLSKGFVQPTNLEIFTCNVDGSDLRQVTHLGGANWAPYFHPKGDRIVFASNHHAPDRRRFNLFSVKIDGSDLQQITFDENFDSFPMFSRDGRYLVFASNRKNGGTRDTNVFLAEWTD
jgi:Tol biopolymer transport system component